MRQRGAFSRPDTLLDSTEYIIYCMYYPNSRQLAQQQESGLSCLAFFVYIYIRFLKVI